jgi:benzoyl-CoA 2,3-epoxidase subunit A
VSAVLGEPDTHIFIRGLKGMKWELIRRLRTSASNRVTIGDWSALKPDMRTSGRYHAETY